MKEKQKNSISIFILNYDWRDIFHTNFNELKTKLIRDQLGPGKNKLFFFSWSKVNKRSSDGNYEAVHKKTRLYKLKPLLDLRAIFEVSYTAYKNKLHPQIWFTYDFNMLPALWIAKKLFGGKLVLCVTNEPRVYSRTRKYGAIKGFYSFLGEHLWWRLVDKFYTINKNMKTYLEGIGIPAERIFIFYSDTIDRDSEHIQKSRKGLVRSKFNIPAETKILLSVARLEAEKNFSELIDLFAWFPDSNCTLVIVGDGTLFGSLSAQVRQLEIEKKIIFAGTQYRDQIWNFYQDADAFILLSKAEALGLVFWEAMHMNVPVIGSDADGIVETIGSDGDRGRIWSRENGQDGFNERLRFCINQSLEREAMIRRAKEYVDQQRRNSITINDLC